MTSHEQHITNLPGGRGRRLYYFQGNFFFPLDLEGAEPGVVKRGIREFMRAHGAQVAADRAAPEYRTPLQLFEEACQS